MKRILRNIFLFVAFLAGCGMLWWYFFNQRSIPSQARCIPANAAVVVTFNVRALALDMAGDEHLFPRPGKNNVPEVIAPFVRAVQANGGSGLATTADVVAFFYRDGDAAFIAIAAEMKDSAKFSALVRGELSKQFTLQPLKGNRFPVLQVDSSSTVISWSSTVALVVIPFSNHDAATASAQCVKLLSLKKEESLLSDKNFSEEELNSFDVSVWMNAAGMRSFLSGGKLSTPLLNGLNYAAMDIHFRAGEIDVRSVLFMQNDKGNEIKQETVLLPCDPKLVKAFWHQHLDLGTDSLVNCWSAITPLHELPFTDQQVNLLVKKTFDGNSTFLFHDTVHYTENYTAFVQRDDVFDLVPKTMQKQASATAMSFCAGLKNEKLADSLVNAWAKEDSIVKTGNHFDFKINDVPASLFIADNMLTISTLPQVDGRKRDVPVAWTDYDAFIPAGDYLQNGGGDFITFFFPSVAKTVTLIGENMGNMTVSLPVVVNDRRSSECRILFRNDKVNALVQLCDLVRKATGN